MLFPCLSSARMISSAACRQLHCESAIFVVVGFRLFILCASTTPKNMSNFGVVSPWFIRDDPYQNASFHQLLHRGDLVEFYRGSYSHWAVYIGEIAVEDPVDGLLNMCPMVVHRANPVLPEGGGGGSGLASWTSSISISSSTGAKTGGDICFEKLDSVWGIAKARINNNLDNTVEPYSVLEIVERAISSVGPQQGLQRLSYNVLINNCEHFATYIRNGSAFSEQVTRRVRQFMTVGGLVGAAMLPRPVSVIAAGVGAWLMGTHRARIT